MYDNRYIWRGIVPNSLTRARTFLLPPYISNGPKFLTHLLC